MLKKILFFHFFCSIIVIKAMDAPNTKESKLAWPILTKEHGCRFIDALMKQKYNELKNGINRLSAAELDLAKKALNECYSSAIARSLYTFVGHDRQIISGMYSPIGSTILTGSADKTARLWDLSMIPHPYRIFNCHKDQISSLAFSGDGLYAILGSWDNTASVWDLTKHEPTHRILAIHKDSITSVALSAKGRHALTASQDKTACLWDLSTLLPTSYFLTQEVDWVGHVAFSPNGDVCIAASANRVKVWNLNLSVNLHQTLDCTSTVTALLFSR